MKTCTKCGEVKPLGEFYKYDKMLDGHLSHCKKRHIKRQIENQRGKRLDPNFVLKERARSRSINAKRREAGIKKDHGTRSRKRPPEKVAAMNAVNKAIISGRIQRQPCEVCGVANAEAHHPNYDRPLDVQWLCRKHHTELHVHLREMEFLANLAAA